MQCEITHTFVKLCNKLSWIINICKPLPNYKNIAWIHWHHANVYLSSFRTVVSRLAEWHCYESMTYFLFGLDTFENLSDWLTGVGVISVTAIKWHFYVIISLFHGKCLNWYILNCYAVTTFSENKNASNIMVKEIQYQNIIWWMVIHDKEVF